MGVTNKTPEFLAKFPIGKVPALETHSADPVYVTESSAIAYFVADSGPARDRLLGKNPKERAAIQQWIFHSENEILPQISIGVYPIRGFSTFDQAADDKATAALDRVLAAVEVRLAKETWLAGTKESSLADFTVAGTLSWGWKYWKGAEYRAQYPKVIEWYTRVVESEEAKDIFGPQEFKA